MISVAALQGTAPEHKGLTASTCREIRGHERVGFCPKRAQTASAYPGMLDNARRRLILNHVVKYSGAPLDRTFAALADPTRRALLARLAEAPDLSVSALAEPFKVSLPAIMKHLDVLSDAGLVARTKSGRTVTCRLNAAPMQDAIAWLDRYERFWSEALSRLSDFLEEEEPWPSTPPSSQASQSSGASKRPPPKSSRPGPTRKR